MLISFIFLAFLVVVLSTSSPSCRMHFLGSVTRGTRGLVSVACWFAYPFLLLRA